jgi:hypothetical protein
LLLRRLGRASCASNWPSSIQLMVTGAEGSNCAGALRIAPWQLTNRRPSTRWV